MCLWTLRISKQTTIVRAKSLQSCTTLCDPMDRSPPGSSIQRFPQARILELAAIPFSRGIFPADQGLNPFLLHRLYWRQILYH